jgi:hypothetical protein
MHGKCIHHAKQALCHENMWESGCIAPTFLASALEGGEWSASHPCHFTPGERAPSTHWIGGWVGPRFGLRPSKLKRSANWELQLPYSTVYDIIYKCLCLHAYKIQLCQHMTSLIILPWESAWVH